MEKTARIYVAGAETLVGKALLRQLQAGDYSGLVGASPAEPDLTDGAKVEAYFAAMKPQYVFLAAGKSGGIGANQRYPCRSHAR